MRVYERFTRPGAGWAIVSAPKRARRMDRSSGHPVTSRVRKRDHPVFERDGYRCVQCGATENLTLDHRVPKSRGGTNAHSNLQTMCVDCNARKGNAMPAAA